MCVSARCVRGAAICGLMAASLGLAASPAAAEQTAVVVVTMSGKAPGDRLPFFVQQSNGGRGQEGAVVFGGTAQGPHEFPSGPGFPQVVMNPGASAGPGGVAMFGNVRFSDRGPGAVGNASLNVLGLTGDTITLQGTPAQAGKHLTLNGAFEVTLNSFSTSATDRASAQFPKPPTSAGFADADSHLTLSLSGTGISAGAVTLAESRHGIDNEHGVVFDLDRHVAQVPFHLDMIVGQPTDIGFAVELNGFFSANDFTATPFSGDDGDAVLDMADFNTRVQWVSANASLTDPQTRQVVHGFSLGSESGFDWLGSGDGTIGPPPVPEPGTWALLICGFGLAGAALRRRRAGAGLGSVNALPQRQPNQPLPT